MVIDPAGFEQVNIIGDFPYVSKNLPLDILGAGTYPEGNCTHNYKLLRLLINLPGRLPVASPLVNVSIPDTNVWT